MTGDSTNRSLVLTPPGAGAIAVIRVIGPDALAIVDRIFVARSGLPLAAGPGDRLRYGRLVDAGEVIDDVIVSRAPVPATPAVDVSAHGGIRVVERILESFERLGAGLWNGDEARAGIWPAANLIEREALIALNRAKTARAVRFLSWQRIHLANELERVASVCASSPGESRKKLQTMAGGFTPARTLLHGGTVAIIGPPNAGKSTLFNRLVGRSSAMVSPGAGTTRDWVSESVDMDGVPLTLVDTAGRDEPADDSECRAMRAGRAAAEKAELVLLVLDASQELPSEHSDLWETCRSLCRCLTVINKTDKQRIWDRAAASSAFDALDDAMDVSAKSGAGLEQLVRVILESLGFGGWVDGCPRLFTARQVNVVRGALTDLTARPLKARTRIRRDLIGFGRGGDFWVDVRQLGS